MTRLVLMTGLAIVGAASALAQSHAECEVLALNDYTYTPANGNIMERTAVSGASQ
jgi:hypothetical protein